MTDLGSLPGNNNNNSAVSAINSRGWMVGVSQSAITDPVVGIPEFHAVLWEADRQIIDLGTLGTGPESVGFDGNDSDQVIGFSTINTSADPTGFGFFGFPTHAFVWEHGVMRDIGTLGGPDAFPGSSCNGSPHNVVAGISTISATINASTGLPTLENFIWIDGKMTGSRQSRWDNGRQRMRQPRESSYRRSQSSRRPEAACVLLE